MKLCAAGHFHDRVEDASRCDERARPARAPQRIQLRRTKGWRMPDGCRKVDRSTRYGNPTLDELVGDLAGKDLACWCPIGSPCHADSLLETIAAATLV